MPTYGGAGRDRAFKTGAQQDQQEHGANISLAKQFRANVITLYGDDIVEQVASYARQNGISKIVIGRSVRKRHILYMRPTIIDRLIKAVPNMDVYVIPDATAEERRYKVSTDQKRKVWADVFKTGAVMALCTVCSWCWITMGWGSSMRP